MLFTWWFVFVGWLLVAVWLLLTTDAEPGEKQHSTQHDNDNPRKQSKYNGLLQAS